MKNTKIRLLLLCMIAIGYGEAATAQIPADMTRSVITYEACHPWRCWQGVSREVTADLITDSVGIIRQVCVSAAVESFSSNNSSRDCRILDITEAQLYPDITFISVQLDGRDSIVQVTGILDFHGMQKLITFEAGIVYWENEIRIQGEFMVRLSQFRIEPPGLFAWVLSDKMKVSLDLSFNTSSLLTSYARY